MNTPWGAAQYQKSIVRGVTFVGTAGHGGVMVSKGFAEKNLSPAAIKRGIVYGGYYAYEEDCDYAIPKYELVQAGIWPMENKEESLAGLLGTLSRWNADYLLDRGIEPEEKGYAFYQENKMEDMMRKSGHPDLVVAAWGDWHHKIPGTVQVITADRTFHLVTAESYANRSGINLLSKLETVPIPEGVVLKG